MAWIYLAESADSQSHSQNGSDLSPIAKSTPIVKQYSSTEWQKKGLGWHPSGTMCVHCLYDISQMELIYYMGDSHARTLALQVAERAWKESEADYFLRSCAWPKKSSQSSYSLRMSPQSVAVEGERSLSRIPEWGMIVDGVLFPLRRSERYTVGKGGFYWPTPNTMDHMALRSEEALKRQFLTTRKGRTKPSNLREAINPECWPQNLFPTPSARDWKDKGTEPSAQARKSPCLPAYVNMMFPTPQACDATKDPAKEYVPNGKQSSMRNLVTIAAKFSTTGKILNPQFVEWLMGYPIGWTELEDWAMQSFLAKRKKRSKS